MVAEPVSYAYNGIFTTIGRVNKIEKACFSSIYDPGTLISGGLAGALARAVTLPFCLGGPKGIRRTVFRRIPQLGLLVWFYCPVAASLLPGLEKDPATKMIMTFMIGANAGFLMRFFCNPMQRVGDESMRTKNSLLRTVKIFKSKTILQFFYCGHPLLANALYYGVLFTVFEALRRYSERNKIVLYPNSDQVSNVVHKIAHPDYISADKILKEDNYSRETLASLKSAAANFVLGGVSAGIASTICYPFSAHRYLQTVIHQSSICRGLRPTLQKEIPLMATFFGTFTLLQPYFSPRHGSRVGFGY